MLCGVNRALAVPVSVDPEFLLVCIALCSAQRKITDRGREEAYRLPANERMKKQRGIEMAQTSATGSSYERFSGQARLW